MFGKAKTQKKTTTKSDQARKQTKKAKKQTRKINKSPKKRRKEAPHQPKLVPTQKRKRETSQIQTARLSTISGTPRKKKRSTFYKKKIKSKLKKSIQPPKARQ